MIHPVLSFIISRGKRKGKIAFLLDSGANFSCISKIAVEKYIGKFRSRPENFLVSTFSYSRIESKGYNYPAEITLHCGKKINVNFFVNETLDSNQSFLLANKIIDNIRLASIPLHPDYQWQDLGYFGKKVECWGILGTDVLQHIKPYSHEELLVCGDKKANFIKIGNGYVPFGKPEVFLSSGDVDRFYFQMYTLLADVDENFKKWFQTKMRKIIFERTATKGRNSGVYHVMKSRTNRCTSHRNVIDIYSKRNMRRRHRSVVRPASFNDREKSHLQLTIRPIVSLTVSRGNRKAKIAFLLDSGASTSSICKDAVEKYIGKFRCPILNKNVRKITQSTIQNGYKYSADITLPSLQGWKINVNFFVRENIGSMYNYPMLDNIINNMCLASIPLHADYPYQGSGSSSSIEVSGILGVDVLQHIKPYSYEELLICGNKKASFVKIGNGYIPFGDLKFFLSSREINSLYRKIYVNSNDEDLKISLKYKLRKKRKVTKKERK